MGIVSEGKRELADVHVIVPVHIHELIKSRAKEENMRISDYVKYTVMMDCVFSGKSEAYKMLASSFSRAFMEWFGGRVKEISRLRLEKVD